jgi:secreted trypsin-like serine protease
MKHVQWILAGTVALTLAACGQRDAEQDASDTKIVGGTSVTDTDVVTSSTVALLQPSGNAFCTGSLIAPRVVLTASHCLEDYTGAMYVVFGTTAKPGTFPTKLRVTVATYKQNEKFDPQAMDRDPVRSAPNDIALVKLSEDAPAGFKPVSMLPADGALTVGERLTLAGFGLTNYIGVGSGTLRKVNVKLTAVSKVGKEIEFGDSPGHSACMGDSGGPAFVTRRGKLVLVGVTSRGSSHCNGSGIYTDVRQFRDWITKRSASL